MMIDTKTALLVGAAIASPWLLGSAAAVGVPIPVYVTGGQRAALAAFPSVVAGVNTAPVGAALADTQSLYARWNLVNASLLAANGPWTGKTYANAAWNPTKIAKLSPSQARELAQAVKAAADAGMAAATEPYPAELADTEAYQNLVGLLAADSTWGSDEDDAADFPAGILALVLELDQRGYLPWGKPIEPTVWGGIGAAADAVESFVTRTSGAALGGVAKLAVGALLSEPGLLLVGGVIAYKVVHR